MLWIAIAVLSYFLSAVVAVLDKFLLSGRIASAAMYAFLMALFSSFVLVLIPFGVQWYGRYPVGLAILSGFLFLYALVAFYTAAKHSEIAKVAPLVGVVVAVASFVITSGMRLSQGEPTGMSAEVLLAFALLIGGAFLISFDLPLRKTDRVPFLAVVSGLLFALSIIILKLSIVEMNFVNGYFWSRAGMFFAGFSLLLIPLYRHEILAASSHFSQPHRERPLTGFLFIANKVSGGVAAFLLAYAVSIGPLAFVHALNGVQFAFVFLLSLVLSFFFPKVYGEKLALNDWIQKACAIILIVLGIWILSVNGGVSVLL
ncbi:MAG: hypothetical protein WAU28_05365 [Candidatus Moraniibacteriota bacterium]